MKLNLGCGKNPLPDYINVDIVNYPGVNIVADVSQLNQSFYAGSADEIYAKDLIEHFNIKDVPVILKKWSKVLRKNGRLILEFPDARKHCEALINGTWSIDKFNYQFFSEREPGQNIGEDWNLHKSAYDDKLITYILAEAGFVTVDIEHFQTPSTFNMKVTAIKVKDND